MVSMETKSIVVTIKTFRQIKISNRGSLLYQQVYIALIFSCFILGWAFFFSLLFSLSSIFLCLSGSSISLKHQTIRMAHHQLPSYLILSLISRLFFSLSSAAFSAFTAWIDFQ